MSEAISRRLRPETRQRLAKAAIALLFALIFLLGLCTVDDYGRNWDEKGEINIYRMALMEYGEILPFETGFHQALKAMGVIPLFSEHRNGSQQLGLLSPCAAGLRPERDRPAVHPLVARLDVGPVYAGAVRPVRRLPPDGPLPPAGRGGGAAGPVLPPSVRAGALQQQGRGSDGSGGGGAVADPAPAGKAHGGPGAVLRAGGGFLHQYPHHRRGGQPSLRRYGPSVAVAGKALHPPHMAGGARGGTGVSWLLCSADPGSASGPGGIPDLRAAQLLQLFPLEQHGAVLRPGDRPFVGAPAVLLPAGDDRPDHASGPTGVDPAGRSDSSCAGVPVRKPRPCAGRRTLRRFCAFPAGCCLCWA